MLKSVAYICRLNVCDMSEKMPTMARRGLVESLMRCLILHHCPVVIYHV